MFGIVTLQCYVYFRRFAEDSWGFRLLVCLVWLLELGHTIGVCYELYRVTVIFYARPFLIKGFPGFAAVTILGGFITMLVQNFFAIRVFKVLPNPYRYIGVLCFVLSFGRCATSVFAGIQAIPIASIDDYRVKWRILVTALLSLGAAIDVIIALSMLYFLYKKRENTFQRVSRLIDRLVAYTIRTGLVTSIAAVLVVIFFQTSPTTYVWLALYTFLGKLYSNTLLSALNARHELRNELSKSASVEPVPRSSRRNILESSSKHNPFNPAISIEMKTTTEISIDESRMYNQIPMTPLSALSEEKIYGPQSPDKVYQGPTAV